MLSQGSQRAAGRAQRRAARVGERPAPDRVILEGAGLAAGAEVRVGRRFHGCHAGVVGVQVGVIHLIHGGEPVQTPVRAFFLWAISDLRLFPNSFGLYISVWRSFPLIIQKTPLNFLSLFSPLCQCVPEALLCALRSV